MAETVLVTGATGFIGRPLVAALTAAGCKVEAHSSADGDIAVPPLRASSGVMHVYHLAARSFVPESWNDTHGYYRTNVLGTATVLDFCRRTGASLTFVSSYVYGQPLHLPIPEEHPLRATNPYSHTKILCEEQVRYYADQFGVRAVVVRPFNIYGPGQSSAFLIPMIVAQALSPEARVIEVADARPRRDYLFVDDFIDLLLRVRRLSCGTYNAGSGSAVSVGEIVDTVNSLLEEPRRLVSRAQQRPAEVMDVVADISRARANLRWEPRTPLREGLRRTIEAARWKPEP
jgi:nucleoside-diphosphate-sugar epimerase